MRNTVIAFSVAVAAITGLAVALPTPQPSLKATPNVKITVGDGHGSGFHIGQGYAFTAAHVVGKATKVNVLLSDGTKSEAEVLWINAARDVALLRLKTTKLQAVNLSCRTPAKGEAVEAAGNPLNLEFVSTWGKVAGKPMKYGRWEKVVPLNMTIVPGQSGGALFSETGYVVGLNVGVMVFPMGFGGSMVGIGYAVPGSTLCELLAKV